MSEDLYALLGVDADADQDELKRAYRRRARELHPDAGGDEEAFKAVTHAYDVLSDPQRRARYDRFGDDGTGRGGAGDPFGYGGFGGLGDVIEAFFGGDPFGGGGRGGRGRQRQSPGRDVLVGVELDLEDVATGTERDIQVDAAVPCETCAGSGSRGDGGPRRCDACGGRGQVRRVVRSAFGQLATTRPCPECEGAGTRIGDPCPDCDGEGRHAGQRTVTVEIPPGVQEGDRLRVGGSGEAGRRGAAAGDLYVEIRVRSHEIFERDGRDLWCEVSVPFVHAALGTTLDVRTITGDTVSVDVPRGSQPGDVLTVKRAGIPRPAGHDPGALNIRLQVEVPRNLSTEEEELLHRFADLRGEQAPSGEGGLLRRLRESFR